MKAMAKGKAGSGSGVFDLAQQIGDLAVVVRPVSELIPYARNARQHSEENVVLIANSIKEFGFTNPVLTDGDNGILAGHGRVLAARKLGLKQVPTIDLAHLTTTQRKAYILADNQTASKSGWDDELLAMELSELVEENVSLATLGFEDKDLKRLLGEDDDEKAPGVTDAPITPTFWIAVSGPFEVQAEALAALRELAKVPGIEIQSNLKGEV